MTESVAGTPGWVDEAIEQIFAELGAETGAARDAFATCLAERKAPATPSDLLGAEFETCHAALRQALLSAGIGQDRIVDVLRSAEALEASIAAES